MKQQSLFKLSNYKSDFGGSLNSKHQRRPLSSQLPMHLVLRCEISRSGSLLKNRKKIESYFKKFEQSFGVKIYKKALVSNHCHIVALFHSRLQYRQFIRALTGALAKSLQVQFLFRPWTRLLQWGRAFNTAIQYTIQNNLEALGLIPYQLRKKSSRAALQVFNLPEFHNAVGIS